MIYKDYSGTPWGAGKLHGAVKGVRSGAPPANPAEGDRYAVYNGTGAFAGAAGFYLYYGTSWVSTDAGKGDMAYDEEQGSSIVWNGTSFVASGLAGATGPAGPQGPVGATGPAGADGSGTSSAGTPIESFGAVGDGTADDTAAFVAAFNSGDTIVLKAGATYNLATWLTYTTLSDIVIVGNGATIVIQGGNFLSAFHSIDISNCNFVGPVGRTLIRGVLTEDTHLTPNIDFIKFNNNTCENLSVMNMSRGFNYIEIVGNRINNPAYGAAYIGTMDETIWDTDRNHNVYIKNNIITNCHSNGDLGYSIYGLLVMAKYLFIQNNIIKNVIGHSVTATETHGIYMKSERFFVSENIIENVSAAGTIGGISSVTLKGPPRWVEGTDQPTTWSQNLIDAGYPAGTVAIPWWMGPAVSHMINNNIICGGTSPGLRSTGEDIIISNNHIDDPLVAGIVWQTGETKKSRHKIHSNVIYGTQRSGAIGIRGGITGVGLEIHDNLIWNFETTGISAGTGADAGMGDPYSNPSGAGKGVSIVNNRLHNCNISLRVWADMENVVIRGNEISGEMDNVIYLSGSSESPPGKYRNLIIKDNVQFDAAISQPIYLGEGAAINYSIEHVAPIRTSDTVAKYLWINKIGANEVVKVKTEVLARSLDMSNIASFEKLAIIKSDLDSSGTTIATIVAQEDVVPAYPSPASGIGHSIAAAWKNIRITATGLDATTDVSANTLDWNVKFKITSIGN